LLQIFLLGRLFTTEARQLPLDPVQLSLHEAGLLFQNGLLVLHYIVSLLLAETHSTTGSASATPHALSEASLPTGAHPSSSSGAWPVTERSGSIHERHIFLLFNLLLRQPSRALPLHAHCVHGPFDSFSSGNWPRWNASTASRAVLASPRQTLTPPAARTVKAFGPTCPLITVFAPSRHTVSAD
jgi:hypothetical protein